MKIKQTIELEINGQKLQLTASEAKELQKQLNDIFQENYPHPLIPSAPPEPWYPPNVPSQPYPWTAPPVWYCQTEPKTICRS